MRKERSDIYHAERPLPRPEPRNKIKATHRALMWLALAVAFLLLFVFISRIESLQFAAIAVHGNHVVPTEKITDMVEPHLDGAYFSLFPKRNMFLVPSAEIEADLAQNFSRFATVSVSRSDNRTLSVNVEERTGAYLLCSDDQFGLPCFAVDRRGYVFDRAPVYSGQVYFAFADETLAGDSATSSPLGATLLSEGELGRVKAIAYALSDTFRAGGASFEPRGAVVTADGDYKIVFDTKTGRSELLVKEGTPEKLANTLESLLSTKKFIQELASSTESHLSYLDMRFGKKLYYKWASTTPSL